jgi:hypothetical protein
MFLALHYAFICTHAYAPEASQLIEAGLLSLHRSTTPELRLECSAVRVEIPALGLVLIENPMA